ncbi:eukaryotic aspartyl protease superfamily [Trichinella spiralis]|uniref:eukaryotic aspartyl protease superfamily n=1 Tax=Trichinella spiralis TaxID=6334 RepID=UPI0001EFE8E8|nr:eukaryotic aspartyl protease superfamily [Trichinella spiralis]
MRRFLIATLFLITTGFSAKVPIKEIALRIPREWILSIRKLYDNDNSSSYTESLFDSLKHLSFYYVDVEIGTPAQKFRLLVDTASSSLIVVGTEYDSDIATACRKQCHDEDHCCIRVCYKNFNASDWNLGEKCAKHQHFGIANTLGLLFFLLPCDGSLGLGFQTLNKDYSVPLMQRLLRQDKASPPTFTIWIDQSNDDGNFDGQLTIGEYDEEHCQMQTCQWMKLARRRYWEFEFENIVVTNDLEIRNADRTPMKGMFNSRIPWIAMAPAHVKAICNELELEFVSYMPVVKKDSLSTRSFFLLLIKIPCNRQHSLKPMKLVVENKIIPIPTSAYFAQKNDTCYLMIIAAETAQGIDVEFGNYFMRQNCHVYNPHANKMAICNRKQSE